MNNVGSGKKKSPSSFGMSGDGVPTVSVKICIVSEEVNCLVYMSDVVSYMLCWLESIHPIWKAYL